MSETRTGRRIRFATLGTATALGVALLGGSGVGEARGSATVAPAAERSGSAGSDLLPTEGFPLVLDGRYLSASNTIRFYSAEGPYSQQQDPAGTFIGRTVVTGICKVAGQQPDTFDGRGSAEWVIAASDPGQPYFKADRTHATAPDEGLRLSVPVDALSGRHPGILNNCSANTSAG